MRRLFSVGSVLALTFPLVACNGNTQLQDFTKHLQERDCQTSGSLIIGGLTPPSAQVTWTCPKNN